MVPNCRHHSMSSLLSRSPTLQSFLPFSKELQWQGFPRHPCFHQFDHLIFIPTVSSPSPPNLFITLLPLFFPHISFPYSRETGNIRWKKSSMYHFLIYFFCFSSSRDKDFRGSHANLQILFLLARVMIPYSSLPGPQALPVCFGFLISEIPLSRGADNWTGDC